MRNKRKRNPLWNLLTSQGVLPITVTFLLCIFLGHKTKSTGTVLFSRYSIKYGVFLFGMGIWTVTCWRVALDDIQYHRLVARIRRFPLISFVFIIVSSVIILELVYKLQHANILHALFPIIYLLPIFLAIVTWFFSKRSLQEALHQVALLLTSFCISLFLIEGVFRVIILKSKVPKTEQEFTELIASSWPHAIPIEKQPDTFRIMGLADSFGSAGKGLNYHYLLESLLQNERLNVEVVNISKGGYGPIEELKILRQFGGRYHPDLIIHGFYVGNDILDHELSSLGGELMKFHHVPVRPQKGLKSLLPANFVIFRWLINYSKFKTDEKLRQQESSRNGFSGTYSKRYFLDIQQSQMLICRKADTSQNVRWQEVLKTLDDIRNEVERIGAEYMLIIHPIQYQVEDELRQQLQQNYNLSLADYDFKLPQKALLDYCDSKGISCLDLLPSFRAHGAKGGLYLLQDTHYNEAGNRLAAEELYKFLYKYHMISRSSDR